MDWLSASSDVSKGVTVRSNDFANEDSANKSGEENAVINEGKRETSDVFAQLELNTKSQSKHAVSREQMWLQPWLSGR